MPALLHKVKSKVFIFAHRKARGLLDGEYTAVAHGRSLDFEDLRAYVAGDEVRDIDWKASARVGAPLVRQYVANRRQDVVLVADVGRAMSAVSHNGELKRDIAIVALGAIGYLAIRHSDSVSLVYGTEANTQRSASGSTEAHLEGILGLVERHTSESSPPSDLCAQLRYIAQHVKGRKLIFVVADEFDVPPELDGLLRRLRAQHEILWLTIEDVDLLSPQAHRDIDRHTALLDHPELDDSLSREYLERQQRSRGARQETMQRQQIAHNYVKGSDSLLNGIFTLLDRHRHGH